VLPQSGKGIKNKHQTKKKEHLIRLKKNRINFPPQNKLLEVLFKSTLKKI
jgi:hypothetical protein